MFITIVLLPISTVSAAYSSLSLFCERSSKPAPADEIQGDVIHGNKILFAAKRYREVDISSALSKDNYVEEGSLLFLPLFHDVKFTVEVDSFTHDKSSLAMRGRLIDSANGFFFLSKRDGKILASIEIPAQKREFSVIYVPALESHIVLEVDIDRKDVLPEGPVIIP